jgi:hypothetical protein
MRRRVLRALVLGALLARVVFPLFHVHDEGGHEGHHHHGHDKASGPALEPAHVDCAICELLAVKAPGLEPEPAPHVEPARPATGARAHHAAEAPRPALFWVACGPRGPPASSPA